MAKALRHPDQQVVVEVEVVVVVVVVEAVWHFRYL
jgi:hypothetical protein